MNCLNLVLDLFNGNAVFLKLRGYSCAKELAYDEEIYDEAIKTVETNFTSPNFVGQALPVLHNWLKSEGWVGMLIPNGYIAVDVHSIEDGELLILMLDNLEYNYHAIRTLEGFQFILRDSGTVMKNFTNVMTVSGLLVDYRIQMRDYIVIPTPESYHFWVRIADNELVQMPKWFDPLCQVSRD